MNKETWLGLHKEWAESSLKRSGNYFSNGRIPPAIRHKLLSDDLSLLDELSLDELTWPELEPPLSNVPGLNILAGIQSMQAKGHFTCFRAFRYPTVKRICEAVNEKGLSTENYEQERLLSSYCDENYESERKQIQENPLFWVQPQERIVEGVPVFALVNDALQIHRAYRSSTDRVLIDQIQIPMHHLESDAVELYVNSAIDTEFRSTKRDFRVKDFKTDIFPRLDYGSLRARGIDAHELFLRGLPRTKRSQDDFGVKQNFFLLDVEQINQENDSYKELFRNTQILKDNQDFLHGFFGDQNPFSRRPTEYLPIACYQVKKAEEQDVEVC